MRQARAEAGEQHTGGGDADQRRQIDVAQAPLRQLRVVPTDRDERQSAGNGDRKAAGRGSRHRLLHRHAAPTEERHGQRTAADAEDRRGPADHRAGQGQAALAGHLAATLWLEIENHLQSDQDGEHPDYLLQQRPLDLRRGQRAEGTADEDAEGHPGEHRPAHRAAPMVFENGIDRSEDDGRQGGADRHLGQDVAAETVRGEAEDQRRDDDQAATDAEQSGQHAGTGAQHDIEEKLHARPRWKAGMVTELRAVRQASCLNGDGGCL